MSGQATEIVLALGELNFTGNIIPETWYQWLCKEVPVKRDGTMGWRPYLEAIVILSDICYWYRPRYVRDELSGNLVAIEKRFAADKLQRSYQDLADRFGMGKDQARNAITWLVEQGYITTELRTIQARGTTLANVLFIEPCIEAITRISRPYMPPVEGGIGSATDRVSVLQPIPVGSTTDTYTESTIETTPETTLEEPAAPATQTRPETFDERLARIRAEAAEQDRKRSQALRGTRTEPADDADGKGRPKWQQPETEDLQKYLEASYSRWFKTKDLRSRAVMFFKAVAAGDVLADGVYQVILDRLAKTDEIPPDLPMPRSWFDWVYSISRRHHWAQEPFADYLHKAEELRTHCRVMLKQRSKMNGQTNGTTPSGYSNPDEEAYLKELAAAIAARGSGNPTG